MAAVAGDDDVVAPQPDAGVLAGAEVGVAGVAGESLELAGEREAISLGDPPGKANVLSCTVVVTLGGGAFRKYGETLYPLFGYCHSEWGGGGFPGRDRTRIEVFLYCPMRVILPLQQILFGCSTTAFRKR